MQPGEMTFDEDDGLTEAELEAAFSAAIETADDAVDAAERTMAERLPAASEGSAEPKTFVLTRPQLPPREVVEAALFVGAEPLSARRLARLLETDDVDGVDALIAGLNADYDRDGRPYEIRLREGGYRMELRQAFEPYRDRLYGSGPREVRLATELVELLSVVAYEQPLAADRLAELPRKSPKRLVGQLVRRGLVELRETEGEQAYVTTDRFLDVLGLRELDDLPQPQVLSIR